MEPIKRKVFFALVLLVLFGFLSISFIVAKAGSVFLSMNSILNVSSSKYSFVNSQAKSIEGVNDVRLAEGENSGNIVSRAEAAAPEDQLNLNEQEESQPERDRKGALLGPVHVGVTATLFWVGEDSSDDNGHISNVPSAWDDEWSRSFGGVDDPEKRRDFFPAKFTPKENPFYFALPYNDFDESGERKKEVMTLIPWFHEKPWNESESLCKNRWIKIMKGDKAAYAQWEDVGPFGEADKGYVFGNDTPKSSTNEHAGIDLSPAVTEYLGLSGEEKVDWQFVAQTDVPNGPWKRIVTTSGVRWN